MTVSEDEREERGDPKARNEDSEETCSYSCGENDALGSGAVQKMGDPQCGMLQSDLLMLYGYMAV